MSFCWFCHVAAHFTYNGNDIRQLMQAILNCVNNFFFCRKLILGIFFLYKTGNPIMLILDSWERDTNKQIRWNFSQKHAHKISARLSDSLFTWSRIRWNNSYWQKTHLKLPSVSHIAAKTTVIKQILETTHGEQTYTVEKIRRVFGDNSGTIFHIST